MVKSNGAPAGLIQKTLVIGWGGQDPVCLPSQSKLALRLFPDAVLIGVGAAVIVVSYL